jgi:ribosome maturation protein SDO1
MENVNVEIRIPTEYAARAFGAVKGYGTLKKDEWRADGSWHGVIEMPAGSYAALLEKLGEITRGTAEAKII